MNVRKTSVERKATKRSPARPEKESDNSTPRHVNIVDLNKLALAQREENFEAHVQDCVEEINERKRKASLSPEALREEE